MSVHRTEAPANPLPGGEQTWCCEVQDGRARHPLPVLMLTRSMALLLSCSKCARHHIPWPSVLSYYVALTVRWNHDADILFLQYQCLRFIRSQSVSQSPAPQSNVWAWCFFVSPLYTICDDPIFSSPSYMTMLRDECCSFFTMDMTAPQLCTVTCQWHSLTTCFCCIVVFSRSQEYWLEFLPSTEPDISWKGRVKSSGYWWVCVKLVLYFFFLFNI